jgi:hypothetical protein
MTLALVLAAGVAVAGGMIAGLLLVVAVVIHREEKGYTLSNENPGPITRCVRAIVGFHGRCPRDRYELRGDEARPVTVTGWRSTRHEG